MTVRIGNLCGLRIIWRDPSMFEHWGRHRGSCGGSFCLGRSRVYWWWA